jgi:hypothetical protein
MATLDAKDGKAEAGFKVLIVHGLLVGRLRLEYRGAPEVSKGTSS